MALSLKVITAYKETFNSVIQVEKEARVALRTQALLFSLQVRGHAMGIMEAQKRKSLKLGDVVTGVAAQLAIEFPSMQIDNFIDGIFGSSVPYNVEKKSLGDKILTYSVFTDEQTSRLFINNDGHVQINHKNTLRVSEIERLLATSRKAHRTANAFLAICVDQYVQNLLSAAEARVTHDNKKRVKVEHLNLFKYSDEVHSSLAQFKKSKDDVETEVAVEVDGDVVAAEVVIAPAAPTVAAVQEIVPEAVPEVTPAPPAPKKGRAKKPAADKPAAEPAVETEAKIEAPAAVDSKTEVAEPPAKKPRSKKTA